MTEFRVLELLARHPGKVFSRQSIIDAVWSSRRDIEDNTVDVFIRLLRKKIEEGSKTKLIHTHRGFGYSVGAPN